MHGLVRSDLLPPYSLPTARLVPIRETASKQPAFSYFSIAQHPNYMLPPWKRCGEVVVAQYMLTPPSNPLPVLPPTNPRWEDPLHPQLA